MCILYYFVNNGSVAPPWRRLPPLPLLLMFVLMSLSHCEPKHQVLSTISSPLSSNEDGDSSILLFKFFRYIDQIPPSELSHQCRLAIDFFHTHRNQSWAQKMIDSNSVIESGTREGNIQFLGSFDQCLATKTPDYFPVTSKVKGLQYCTLTFPISMLLTPDEIKHYPPIIAQLVPPQAGICYPQACREETDLKRILAEFTKMTNQSVEITNCVTAEDLQLDHRFQPLHVYILIGFLGLLSTCCLATVLDHLICPEMRHSITTLAKETKSESTYLTRILFCFSVKRNLQELFAGVVGKAEKSPRPITKDEEEVFESRDPNRPSMVNHQGKLIHHQYSDHFSSTSVLTDLDFVAYGSSSSSSSNVANQQQQRTQAQQMNDGEIGSESSESHATIITVEQQPKDDEINLVQTTTTRAPQIDCLHGIRFISFAFILSYHTFTEGQTPSSNLLRVLEAERTFARQLVTNAALWVDTFFLLSGFLVTHSALYKYPQDFTGSSKTSSVFSVLKRHPRQLLHRYLRLTPSVLAVVGLSILIEPLGSGPNWYQYVRQSTDTCHRTWYGLLLYVNNVCALNQPGQASTECLSYLWYLAVDMQFFLVSPLLICLLVHRSKRIQYAGIGVNVLVIVGSCSATGYLISSRGLTPTVLVNFYDLSYINQVYKASYCRIGPYCIGILLAYVLKEKQSSKQSKIDQLLPNWNLKRKLSGFCLLIFWLVLTLAPTLMTYQWLQKSSFTSSWLSVLYGATHRSIWALGWALVVYACSNGFLRPLNQFLSAPGWHSLSRLTYQSYLLHSVLIAAVNRSSREKFYFSDWNFISTTAQNLMLTTAVSTGTYVLVERPVLNLEQTLL